MYRVHTHVEKKEMRMRVKDEEVEKNVFLVNSNSFMYVSICSRKSSDYIEYLKENVIITCQNKFVSEQNDLSQ